MKKIMIIVAIATAMPMAAQTQNDSTAIEDSIFRSLPEVMVSGRKPIVKAESGKLVFDMGALTKDRPVDNAYDALKEIPGVTEKDDKLQLNGRSVSLILDGKVSTMTSEQLQTLLKSIPKDRVQKCEVMYNAPARYQVRGQAINIVLRHGGFDGLQAELFGTYRQKHDATFEERASVLYNKGKVELDLLYSHNHGKTFAERGENYLHTLNTGEQYSFNTSTTIHNRYHNHNYRLGLNYDIAKDNLLSVVYTGSYHPSHNLQDVFGNIVSTNQKDGKSWLHDVRADWTTPLGMKMGAEYTRHTSPDTQTLNSRYADKQMNYEIVNDQKIDRWKAYISEEHNLGKGWTANYGATVTTTKDNSYQTYKLIDSQSDAAPSDTHTDKRETIVNVYGGASKAFGEKLQLDFSLASEYLHSSVWNGWDLFPTLNLTYTPKPGNILSFGISSERTYPNYWTVGDFTSYINGGYGEIVGNPDLQPSRDYSATLSYVLHGKYIFAVWMEYDNNYFMQMAYQRPDELTAEYKYVNSNYRQEFGFQASAPLPLGKKINSRLTLIGFYQRERNDQFYDIPYDRSKWIFIANLNNTFTLSKQLALTLDGHLQSKAIQGPYDIRPMSYVKASLRWKLLKDKLSLNLFCNDIFETSKVHFTDRWKGQNIEMKITAYREAGITLTYKFGNYKEPGREAVDTSRFK